MDDIVALKNKHLKITDSQMKELLQNKIQLIDHIKNKQSQHCSEDEMKIKELTSEVTSMKQSLQDEKEILECKNHDLSSHSDCITKLETERSKFLEENQQLESQRNRLRAAKPNLQDEKLLNEGRRKLKLYKQLTRIAWDYEDLKENATGYVSNKKDYIHHFCYKNDVTNLTDLLWQEIYQSTITTDSGAAHNKENIVQNQLA